MTTHRQDAGPRPLTITLDGEPFAGTEGQTIAGMLLAARRRSWRTTSVDAAPRGVFCGIGVCFDCIVEIDGESGQRACMIPLEDGMEVCAARSAPRDGGAASGGTTANEPNPEAQSQ